MATELLAFEKFARRKLWAIMFPFVDCFDLATLFAAGKATDAEIGGVDALADLCVRGDACPAALLLPESTLFDLTIEGAGCTIEFDADV